MILILLCAFATYRLSRLIALDNGPFDVIKNARRFLGAMAAVKYQKAWRSALVRTLAELVHCQFCSGVWIALVFSLLVQFNYPWWLAWLAIAGIQAVIVGVVDRE